MNEERWIVIRVPRDPEMGDGARIAYATTEEDAVALAGEKRREYDPLTWEIKIEGPKDWSTGLDQD
jgi:hypothetical protein